MTYDPFIRRISERADDPAGCMYHYFKPNLQGGATCVVCGETVDGDEL